MSKLNIDAGEKVRGSPLSGATEYAVEVPWRLEHERTGEESGSPSHHLIVASWAASPGRFSRKEKSKGSVL